MQPWKREVVSVSLQISSDKETENQQLRRENKYLKQLLMNMVRYIGENQSNDPTSITTCICFKCKQKCVSKYVLILIIIIY